MTQISLKCKCGAVEGSIENVSPDVGNHIVCYCNDCQAFANHLPASEEILDEWGGTRIYQTAPWNIRIDKGIENLQCLRLTPKGLNRWYTECCKTPVGNNISAKLPFMGVIHSFFDQDEQAESKLGPVRGYHKLESAKDGVPASIMDTGMPLRTTVAVFWRLLKWKLTGRNRPNLFFTESGQCISRPKILKNSPK